MIQKKIDVPVYDRARCEQKYQDLLKRNDFKLLEGEICAGGEEGKDACQGILFVYIFAKSAVCLHFIQIR